MKISFVKDEMEIYKQTKKDYDKIILNIKHQIDILEEQERDQLFEFEVMVELFGNLYKNYKKSDFVRKRKISSLLFSHIEISKNKKIKMTPNKGLELLFQNPKNNKKNLSQGQISFGAPNPEYFEHLISIIKNTPNDKLSIWKPIFSGFLDVPKIYSYGEG